MQEASDQCASALQQEIDCLKAELALANARIGIMGQRLVRERRLAADAAVESEDAMGQLRRQLMVEREAAQAEARELQMKVGESRDLVCGCVQCTVHEVSEHLCIADRLVG